LAQAILAQGPGFGRVDPPDFSSELAAKPAAMGISRDSRHKKRKTGGVRNIHQKKRKFERGRAPALCKLGQSRVRKVRCRGGNRKYRALRADHGNFAWGSERCTRKVRLLDVVYNATSNELVRTKTLTKNTIIQIDAQPFKQWYLKYYGVDLSRKKPGQKKAAEAEKEKEAEEKKPADKKGKEKESAGKDKDKVKKKGEKEKGKDKKEEEKKGEEGEYRPSRHVRAKQRHRLAKQKLDPLLEEQMMAGRVLACIASRPGQCGRVDGYIIEGEELVFYKKRLEKRKRKD